MTASAPRARGIRLLVLDVDGVLTDGGLYLGPNGEEWKRFHVHDGAGIKAVQRAGIQVAIVSGRSSPAVDRRAVELDVRHVIQAATDKARAVDRLRRESGLGQESVAAVGDDLGDLAMLRRAGFAIAVANAHPEVKAVAHWVTAAAGGHGAVREICDLLLSAASRSAEAAGAPEVD